MSTFSFLAAAAASGQTNATKEVMASDNSIYGILYFLFMSAVILGASYYVTKFIARKGFRASGNKNLKIIETISLGIDKSLLLVKVGEQYLLLGSTQKNISLLTELEQEKLTIANTNEVYNNLDSEGVLSYMDKLESEDRSESMNSVKQNLNKLKSIVRGNKIDG